MASKAELHLKLAESPLGKALSLELSVKEIPVEPIVKDVVDRIRERTKVLNPYHVGEVGNGAFVEESVQLLIIIVTTMDDERHGVNALKLELLIHLRIN